MLGQVDEQDMPSEQELQEMTCGKSGGGQSMSSSIGGQEESKGTWTEYATSWIPSKESLQSVPSWKSKEGIDTDQQQATKHNNNVTHHDTRSESEKMRPNGSTDGGKTEHDFTNSQKHCRASSEGFSTSNEKKAARTDQPAESRRSPTPRQTAHVTRAQNAKARNEDFESRPSNSQTLLHRDERPKKKPRKLEVRGNK